MSDKWTYERVAEGYGIYDGTDELVMVVLDDSREDLARRIVTTVDAHEALVEALHVARQAIGAPISHQLAQDALHAIRAALALAEVSDGK